MSMTIDDFLMGGGTKSAFGKGDAVGFTVQGQITGTEMRQQTDLETGKALTWDNGDPRMRLVVTIQTDIRDDVDDDGQRTIYVKGSKAAGSQSLHDAIRSAVQAAGANGLETGGMLAVSYVGNEPSKTRGFSDRKLWAASYRAPDRAAESGAFLGVVGGQPTAPALPPVSAPAVAPVSAPIPAGPAPVQPVPMPAPVPAPMPVPAAPAVPAVPVPAPVAAAPAPAANMGAIAQQLIGLGQDDATIAAHTGLDVSVVAMLRAQMAAPAVA